MCDGALPAHDRGCPWVGVGDQRVWVVLAGFGLPTENGDGQLR